MLVREINKYDAIEFIQQHHYSPIMPRLTKHYLGVFVHERLRGVLTLGWGTQPRQTINKMFDGLESDSYWEIGKMCMDDDMPRNSESQMLSLVIRWIKQQHPSKLFLYTMADGIMGKCGYVYQASNFLFGEKYWTQVYMMNNGEKLHPRSAKELCKENARIAGKERVFWLTTDFMQSRGIRKIEGFMFRYIFPLNKRAKRLLKHSNLVWTRNYPKDSDLLWRDVTDRKSMQYIEQPPFTYGSAMYNKQLAAVANLREYFV